MTTKLRLASLVSLVAIVGCSQPSTSPFATDKPTGRVVAVKLDPHRAQPALPASIASHHRHRGGPPSP